MEGNEVNGDGENVVDGDDVVGGRGMGTMRRSMASAAAVAIVASFIDLFAI